MDYASDIDELGYPVRRKRRGDLSFLVIALGTVCLAAAWVLTASDPYTELAHRVEVRPGESGEGGLGLLEAAAASQMRAALPDAPTRTASPHMQPGDEAVIIPPGGLIGPELPAGPLLEGSLGLTRSDRRAIQRRLTLAGHPAGAADGVFGDQTREAIAAYERQWGFPEDGHVDRAMLNSLEERTEANYAEWLAAEKARLRRSRQATRVRTDTAPLPKARQMPAEEGACARNPDGSVVGHQSVVCDVRGLGEGLRSLVRGDLPGRSNPELETAAGSER